MNDEALVGQAAEQIGDRAAIADANATGSVSGFAPPGDIHRVRNSGDRTAISLHIYGTDLTRIGSSVRRYYDLPVLRRSADRRR